MQTKIPRIWVYTDFNTRTGRDIFFSHTSSPSTASLVGIRPNDFLLRGIVRLVADELGPREFGAVIVGLLRRTVDGANSALVAVGTVEAPAVAGVERAPVVELWDVERKRAD